MTGRATREGVGDGDFVICVQVDQVFPTEDVKRLVRLEAEGGRPPAHPSARGPTVGGKRAQDLLVQLALGLPQARRPRDTAALARDSGSGEGRVDQSPASPAARSPSRTQASRGWPA
jgi:hypothetical protein